MQPAIFDDDKNVESLETNSKISLLNIVVEVACKFEIFKLE